MLLSKFLPVMTSPPVTIWDILNIPHEHISLKFSILEKYCAQRIEEMLGGGHFVVVLQNWPILHRQQKQVSNFQP